MKQSHPRAELKPLNCVNTYGQVAMKKKKKKTQTQKIRFYFKLVLTALT